MVLERETKFIKNKNGISKTYMIYEEIFVIKILLGTIFQDN